MQPEFSSISNSIIKVNFLLQSILDKSNGQISHFLHWKNPLNVHVWVRNFEIPLCESAQFKFSVCWQWVRTPARESAPSSSKSESVPLRVFLRCPSRKHSIRGTARTPLIQCQHKAILGGETRQGLEREREQFRWAHYAFYSLCFICTLCTLCKCILCIPIVVKHVCSHSRDA